MENWCGVFFCLNGDLARDVNTMDDVSTKKSCDEDSDRLPHRIGPAARFSGITARAFDLSDRAYQMEDEGEDIIHLSVGDPDFDTPKLIVDSAIASLHDNRTHYSPIPGEPALRAAIANQASKLYAQTIIPDQVIVCSGAQNALFATMSCLAEKGDEVIILEPSYTTYDAAVAAGGASAVRVALSFEEGFQIDIEKIEAAITDRTKAILINSPGNPSGTVYDAAGVANVVKLCRSKGLWVISDEVYSSYVFDGNHNSPASQPGGEDVTFVVNSLSKSHAMTGWRVGWVIAPITVAHQIIDLAQCMLFGVNQFVQDAAVTALTAHIPELNQFRETFRIRRDCLCDGLQKISGLHVGTPAGGMFLLVDVSALGLDGYAFAEQLLDAEGVSVVPGFGFGESLKNFVRIGYLAETNILDDAVQRISRFSKSLK